MAHVPIRLIPVTCLSQGVGEYARRRTVCTAAVPRHQGGEDVGGYCDTSC